MDLMDISLGCSIDLHTSTNIHTPSLSTISTIFTMSSRFRSKLRDLVLKPHKSFSQSLISNIWPFIDSQEHIDDLIHSHYFQKIAWRFFHPDVTNTHIQLILLISYADFERGLTETMALMLEFPEKLQLLIHRVLQITMDLTDTNSTLRRAAFLFLSALVRFNLSILQENKLYKSWCRSIFEKYLGTISTDTFEYKDDVNCFLKFCLCCAIYLEEMRQRIQSLHVSLYFSYASEDLGGALNVRLANLLSTVTKCERNFAECQTNLRKCNLGRSFDFLVMAFTKLDVSHDKLHDFLSNLEEETIHKVAETLAISNVDVPVKVLAETICQCILGPRLSRTELNLENFTETEIFDIVGECKFPPIIPTIPLKLNFANLDFIEFERLRFSWTLLNEIHQHLLSVLDRLVITNGNSEDGIKGKSKYFSKVKASSDSLDTFELKNTGVASSKYVVLLEIGKPANGESLRVKKYGIAGARVAKVKTRQDGEIKLDGARHRQGSTFNSLVALPDLIQLESLEILTNLITATDRKIIQNGIDEPQVKRRKVENDLRSGKDPKMDIFPDDVLNFPKTLSVLDREQKVVDFLEKTHHEHPEQRSLVVFPSRSSVLLFQTPKVETSIFRIGANSTVYKNARKLLLSEVTKISKALDLQDYAFDANFKNALMLYHTHIVPQWEAYLHQLEKSREHAEKYPFAELNREGKSDKEFFAEVSRHYQGILKVFAEIQDLLPLDKLNWADHKEVDKFFMEKSKVVFASAEDLPELHRKFENLLFLTDSPQIWIPIFRNKETTRTIMSFSKLPVFSEFSSTKSSEPVILRKEIAQLTNFTGSTPDFPIVDPESPYNPGFKFVAQHIKVPLGSSNVNIEEARYVVYLYQYFRLLGYPANEISVVVKSPYMRLLIEEILEERSIHKEDKSSGNSTKFQFGLPILGANASVANYTIVSSHPGLSMKEYVDIAGCSRLGMYIVGSQLTAPYKLKSGSLEIYKSDAYKTQRDAREGSKPLVIENSARLRDHVDQLMKSQK